MKIKLLLFKNLRRRKERKEKKEFYPHLAPLRKKKKKNRLHITFRFFSFPQSLRCICSTPPCTLFRPICIKIPSKELMPAMPPCIVPLQPAFELVNTGAQECRRPRRGSWKGHSSWGTEAFASSCGTVGGNSIRCQSIADVLIKSVGWRSSSPGDRSRGCVSPVRVRDLLRCLVQTTVLTKGVHCF